MVGGEQRASATEAGGDLVEDQQHAGLIAGLAQHGQIAGSWNRIPPAPWTTGSTMTAAGSSACGDGRPQNLRVSIVVRWPVARRRRPGRPGRRSTSRTYRRRRGRHAHQREGVAVTPRARSSNRVLECLPIPASTAAPSSPRPRPTPSPNHRRTPCPSGRGGLDEPRGEFDRRAVGKTAEHHVAHRAELVDRRRVERTGWW